MQKSTFVVPARQRGISLFGLIFVLAVLGVVGVFGMKVFPTFLEWRSCKEAIASAKATHGTDIEMRQAFDKNADINRIEAISGKDVLITKDTGEPELSFAYQKKVPMFANVSLLIDYEGTTARSALGRAKPPAKIPD
jgi:hypothetical protein